MVVVQANNDAVVALALAAALFAAGLHFGSGASDARGKNRSHGSLALRIRKDA